MGTDEILSAVLDGLLECLVFVELSDDEIVHRAAASEVIDDVRAGFEMLCAQDRAVLADRILFHAGSGSSSAARLFIEGLPGRYGLVDTDH